MKKFTFPITYIVWLLFVVFALYINISEFEKFNNDLAKSNAIRAFNEILLLQEWNMSHNATYEQISDSSQLKKALDIEKKGSILNNMLNMNIYNQVSKTSSDKNDLIFHISSLKPLNQENNPDDWERKSLKEFSKGLKENFEQTINDSNEVFRYMAPLYIEETCIECHASQNYKIGDVKGGISITFPAKPFKKAFISHTYRELMFYAIIFLIGLILIIILEKTIKKGISQLHKKQLLLEEEINERKLTELKLHKTLCDLKDKNSEYATLNEEYMSQNENLVAFNLELEHYNKKLIKLKEKAQESDKLKSAFLANMSHEIRTPLNTIVGFSSFFKNSDLSIEKRKKYSDLIINSSNHLLSLINDILDVSKIEADQIQITESEFFLNKILEEVNQSFNELIKENEKEHLKIIINNGLQNGNDNIISDHTRIKQILFNLISNAVKFTHDGTIELSYSIDNSMILFKVEDTGIGMTENELKIIFNRFRQADSTITRKYGGTGLGLTISKALVNLLGGEIWVSSIKNEGSIFNFSIPFKKGKLVNEATKELNNYHNNNYRNKTILIVEDDIYNTEYLEEVFKPTFAKIISISDGLEAIKIVTENKSIDLVLMDIQMPNLNGYEATKQIKQIRKNLPVIAQTANAMYNDEIKSLEAGCDAYISKPISEMKLFEIVNKFIS